MTKSVDAKLSERKRARLQFSIVELLLFVSLTFLGMGVMHWLAREYEIIAFPLVILATLSGALVGLRNADGGSSKGKFVIGGIVLSWLVSVWMFGIVAVGLREQVSALITLIMFGLPVFVPTVRMFVRPKTTPELQWCSLRATVCFAVLYSVALGIGIRIFLLRSYCGYGHSNAAAEACKEFAEAEEIYHRTDYSKTGIQYATSLQALLGSNGELALIDKTFALAEIGNPQMQPKAGYYFKVLTAQGPHATGGSRCYIDENGQMTLGYALIAIPSAYDVTGRDSFIINNNGTIFQADLGPNTPFLASSITEFDPDTNWVPTQ